MLPAPDLVLASASPRRRELLERLGLAVRVEAVEIDETPAAGESPSELPRRLAAAKCDLVAERLAPTADAQAVLGADTVVVVDGRSLGKPADEAEAAAMLLALGGRRHEVITAYRIRRGAASPIDRAVTTAVTFRLLDRHEVNAYMASGEWRGKAGGYAVQGIAAVFVTDIRGSLTNVIGLPLAEAIADLRAAGALPGYPPRAFGRPA